MTEWYKVPKTIVKNDVTNGAKRKAPSVKTPDFLFIVGAW